jgi:amidohydrolase
VAGGIRDGIDRQSADVAQHVTGWFRQIHQDPELPNREAATARLVADHLEGLGFDDVRTGVARHGVVGVLKGGGSGVKVMGLRADMDALPIRELQDLPYRSTKVDSDYPGGPFPVAHMCGHDAHTAMLMGAATVLANVRSELPGTVKFIFQPAEEGPPIAEPGGAAMMIEQGVLDDPRPDMMFALHTGPFPDNTVLYTPDHALASSDYLSIKIRGAGVHGSTPWLGKDPMPVAAEIISALAQVYRQVPATDAMTISIGKVIGDGRFNIIGSDIELIGTVRVLRNELIGDVHERVERIAGHVAEAHGLTATTEFKQHVPALNNDPKWLERTLPTVRRVMGDDKVIEMPPVLVYDDASEFVNTIGGVYLFLGGQDVEFADGVPRVKEGGRGHWFNHSPNFYWNDSNLVHGVRLHSHVTLDFLCGNI